MRLAPLYSVLLGTFLVAGAVMAAPGDPLFIQGDEVNIRQAPSTSAPVIMQLDHDHRLFELQRDGDWVNVSIDGAGGQDGWVHGSLVGPEGPDDALAVTDEPRIAQFRTGVLALNEKAYRASGANHFTAVSDLGDGIVRVTATEAWVATEQAARQRDMDALFALWDEAEGTGLPIMVQVVDRDDQVVMTRSRR